jgi:hypothetical protein
MQLIAECEQQRDHDQDRDEQEVTQPLHTAARLLESELAAGASMDHALFPLLWQRDLAPGT